MGILTCKAGRAVSYLITRILRMNYPENVLVVSYPSNENWTLY